MQSDNNLLVPIDLPRILPNAIKEYLDSYKSKDLYLVLDRRFALNQKKELTLDEVGKALRVSRERIRQKQKQALDYLMEGFTTTKLLDISIDSDLKLEARNLLMLLKTPNPYTEEDELFNIVENRYSHKLNYREKSHIRLLFHVFGFVPYNISRCKVFWKTNESPYSQDDLSYVSEACSKILHEEVVPISYFDLLISLSSYSKEKRLPEDKLLRFVLDMNIDIEKLDNDYYQIDFSSLRGAASLAYRILWEANEKPMHSDDIAKEINYRLVSKRKRTIGKGTVVNGMSRSKRFSTIGKSGLWGLSEWDLVQSTVVELMIEAFHELKRPANAGEIYSYVKKFRDDASRGSVSTYLSDRPEFVQVGRGLYQPRAWKITDEAKQQRKQIRQQWSMEKYTQVIIETFNENNTEVMPLRQLTQELAKKSGVSIGAITSNILGKTPVIRKIPAEHGKGKVAILNRDYKFERPSRILLRDKVETTVYEVLSKQPNQIMPLVELRDSVTKLTNCPEKTFYQYLSGIKNIKKETLSNKITVVRLLSHPNTSSDMITNSVVHDVAISYAGQDVEYAKSLVKQLELANLNVFFAPHHQVNLAGDFLPDKLLPVYRDLSRKCVIILSEHYNRSKYTNFERKAALDRKLDEEDYVILVKLDDSELKGWLKSDIYYDARQISISQIANIITKSLQNRGLTQRTK